VYDSIQTVTSRNALNDIFSNNLQHLVEYLRLEKPRTFSTQRVTSAYDDILRKNKLFGHFVAIRTQSDGNCFYHSASLSLFGSQKFYKMIKIGVAKILLENESYMTNIQFHTKSLENFEKLVFDSSLESQWANEFHCLALSILLNRPIHIYNSSELQHFYCARHSAEKNHPLCFVLQHYHFTALMPILPIHLSNIQKPNFEQFRNFKL
jgi:hypothetical protein